MYHSQWGLQHSSSPGIHACTMSCGGGEGRSFGAEQVESAEEKVAAGQPSCRQRRNGVASGQAPASSCSRNSSAACVPPSPRLAGTPPAARSAHVATAFQGRYVLVFGGGSVAHCFDNLFCLDTETLEVRAAAGPQRALIVFAGPPRHACARGLCSSRCAAAAAQEQGGSCLRPALRGCCLRAAPAPNAERRH